MGRRLKVKVELFPARASLESFGLRSEESGGSEEGGGGERRWTGRAELTEMMDTMAVYYLAQFWMMAVLVLTILGRSFRDTRDGRGRTTLTRRARDRIEWIERIRGAERREGVVIAR